MNSGQPAQGGAAAGKEDYVDKGSSDMSLYLSIQAVPKTLHPPSHPNHNLIPPLSSTGLASAEKKYGGGKVNPEQARGVNEKVTDGARGMFEKATGYVTILSPRCF